MSKPFTVLLFLALAGCSSLQGRYAATPCDQGEATYECQVYRYEHVGMQ